MNIDTIGWGPLSGWIVSRDSNRDLRKVGPLESWADGCFCTVPPMVDQKPIPFRAYKISASKHNTSLLQPSHRQRTDRDELVLCRKQKHHVCERTIRGL